LVGKVAFSVRWRMLEVLGQKELQSVEERMVAPLKLLTLNEVPRDCRRKFVPAVHWVSLSLLLTVVIGCVWLALVHTPWGWWGVFWLGGFWLLLMHTALKTRHAEAWLVKVADGGLYIKWRSYQNVTHGREGLQVVFVPFARIAAARSHKKSWTTPENLAGGGREVRHRFLELRLVNSLGIDQLKQYLDDERGGRLQRSRGVWHHYPVSIEANHVVRVEWDVRPSISVLLEDLRSAGVQIDKDLRTAIDLTDATTRDDELQEIARRGDLMALVRVLRVRDKTLDLTQAREQAEAMITHPESGK
jgi:hypothetical protein